jgi:Carboxymuconolactone decarboxylase family
MHMIDWNIYRQQVVTGGGQLCQAQPGDGQGIWRDGRRRGEDRPTRREDPGTDRDCRRDHLRCDGCIAAHTDAAHKLGAATEEVAEALGVAISVNAGAAIVYSTRTLDAYAAWAAVPHFQTGS